MIGATIKRLMKKKGYTQRRLAELSNCTESSISHYIHDEREPTTKVCKSLAVALGVTVDELIADL